MVSRAKLVPGPETWGSPVKPLISWRTQVSDGDVTQETETLMSQGFLSDEATPNPLFFGVGLSMKTENHPAIGVPHFRKPPYLEVTKGL
jgi:hypothetical protein